MMTLACKDLLEPERFSEALFRHHAVASAADEVCRDVEGGPCGHEEL